MDRTQYKRFSRAVVLLFSITIGTSTFAESGSEPAPDPVRVSVSAEPSSVLPGGSFNAVFRFEIDPPWHIYYKEPGDAGLPTRFRWSSTDLVEFGDLEWPAPVEFMQPGRILGRGYTTEAVFRAPVSVGAGAQPGSVLRVVVKIDWLRCADLCVLGWSELALEVPVRDDSSGDG